MKHRTFSRWAILALLVLIPSANASVTLPNVIGSGMVLQREMPVPIWGTANPGEKVTVAFADQSKAATADDSGKWRVTLDALKASDEQATLTVTGTNKITLDNVLVGEVWICSGQSNMEWALRSTKNGKDEIANSDHPKIRLFNVPGHTTSPIPQEKGRGSWQTCSPKSTPGFSAVGYFFGRRLQREVGVPIGLIGSNWGGTRIEPWTTQAGFEAVPELAKLAKQVQGYTDKTRVGGGSPSAIYNSMVHPLTPFAMRGAIWYQGESNGGEGESYYHKTHALVKGWRKAFENDKLAFYWVQLANFQKPNPKPAGGDGWAKIRAAQTKALDIPNTGMAVIIDIGEANDIHPRNKQDVGSRLAQWALHQTYGKKDLVPSGPLYKSLEVEDDSIRINFSHVGKGLMVGKKVGLEPTQEVKDGKLEHFAIAGKDGQWHWAEAVIDGDNVVVKSKNVPNPVAVRYAYSMNPDKANLYNKAGLPAGPFRTDNWLGASEKLNWKPLDDGSAPKSNPGATTTVVFENKSGHEVKIHWIDYGGNPKHYADLKPGGKRQQNTYSNASWLITDAKGKPLGYFRSTSKVGIAVIP